MRTIPFLLSEAVLGLYPADSSGQLVAGDAVWFGASEERLGLRALFATVDMTPTGDAAQRRRMIPQGHEIEVERLWALPIDTLADWQPDPHGSYLLWITWEDAMTQAWYRRVYQDVRCGEASQSSEGVMQFYGTQRFVAASFVETSGYGAYTPAPTVAEQERVFFSHAGACASGQYLLGHYQWGTSRALGTARAIGQGGTGASTVLTLEVNGVLTAHELTLSSGVGEVSGSVDLSGVTIAAGEPVRWQVTSAPALEANQMTGLALVMEAA